uniref:Uncharacterized protein n=1 Tax=Brassica campestris TaxID=3711 RepID=M4FFD2_BRACM
MPDMDSFKLLEHVGLELNLPVISEITSCGCQVNCLLNLLTALIQLWNIDDCYIAVGRDTYIYHWYRQRNKCYGWTSGYGRISSNAKPSLIAEN